MSAPEMRLLRPSTWPRQDVDYQLVAGSDLSWDGRRYAALRELNVMGTHIPRGFDWNGGNWVIGSHDSPVQMLFARHDIEDRRGGVSMIRSDIALLTGWLVVCAFIFLRAGFRLAGAGAYVLAFLALYPARATYYHHRFEWPTWAVLDANTAALAALALIISGTLSIMPP